MKKLLTLLMLLCSVCTYAQDVIVKKDGSTVICRVVELNASQIIYKAWTDLNGDNRVINRSDASAINYQDGKRVNLGEATNLYTPGNQNNGVQQYNDVALLDMRKGDTYIEKAKQIKKVGIIGGCIVFAAGVGLSFYGGHISSFDDPDARNTTMTAGAVLMGVGVVGAATCVFVANSYKKKAKQIQAISIYQQDFNFKNGTTLSPSVDLIKDQALNQQTIGIGLHYNF